MAGKSNWNRHDWFAAVEQLSEDGLAGKSDQCLKALDEWIYKWLPPSDAWALFLEVLRYTSRDPIRPSQWRALRGVLSSMRQAERSSDLDALVKAIQRLGFNQSTGILAFNEDLDTELDDFLEVARQCFEFRRQTEPAAAKDICNDAARRLESWGFTDAAAELRGWSDVSDVHWNELSERQQQIMWILGEKEPSQGGGDRGRGRELPGQQRGSRFQQAATRGSSDKRDPRQHTWRRVLREEVAVGVSAGSAEEVVAGMKVRDIEATIRFVPTSEGGRSTPVRSGYRPQFFYHGRDWDAAHEYPDVDEVEPGDTVKAYLRFASPKFHDGKIRVGMPFQVREGTRVVGEGVVDRILDLPTSSAKDRAESDRTSR